MGNVSNIVKRTVTLLRHRPKGWKSVICNTALAKASISGPLMMPAHISIEPTNVCNARCPVCETGNNSMERARGMLDRKNFEKFIDQVAPTTNVLMYYFMGEPFINRDSYEMIRYARNKNIYVETCTDGDFVDAKGVIYSDINQISFQIGGITQETHQIYRVNSNLDKIERNIRALVEERRKHPTSNVQIELGFIVMRHNEHEIPEFLRWSKELGVDLVNIIDPCVRSVSEGHTYLPEDRKYWFYDEVAFNKGILKPKVVLNNECTWVWNSVMVNWDGSVVSCCRDPHGRLTFGNAFETPLKEIWRSQKMTDFRKKILTQQKDIDMCKLCSGFGVPQLIKKKPLDFEIRRHTLNTSSIEIPKEF
jgi:radical SAM protein with 4Fe4S-binding SPASM domain